MKKKLFYMLFALCGMFTLAACSGSDDADENENNLQLTTTDVTGRWEISSLYVDGKEWTGYFQFNSDKTFWAGIERADNDDDICGSYTVSGNVISLTDTDYNKSAGQIKVTTFSANRMTGKATFIDNTCDWKYSFDYTATK